MITYSEGKFYRNGEEFSVYSGAIHYFRTFAEQWRDRLEKLKAAGLNTVETYCCWNLHEPTEGCFDFSGMLDVERFIALADELGLYVIIRPGPYICAEWDFGGFPGWLLADDGIRLRTTDERYFAKVRRYMRVLMSHIVPHLETNGGNVILVAVENEYGSFGNSRAYMNACAELLRELGVDVPLFTADGHTMAYLNGGRADDVLCALDFGYDDGLLPEHTAAVKTIQPDAPLFHAEHWIGQFAHWGRPLQTYPAETVAREVQQHLDQDMNFNLYMFHGGTNWGFYAGANTVACNQEHRTKTKYYPDVTSYDYDALLTEWGDCTPKFFAVQKVMEKHLGRSLPTPPPVKLQNIGRVSLEECAPLWDNLDAVGTRFTDCLPHNMEHYGQSLGYILYRTEIKTKQPIRFLALEEVHDRVHVYFNGIERGVVYRNDDKPYLEVDGWMDEGGTLELLVENLGHINFGPALCRGDRKGICDNVYIGCGPRQILCDWEIYTLPMQRWDALRYQRAVGRLPAFFRGCFDADTTADCFIDPRGFTKGFVVVNGFNLGRFWNIGPQQTLYLPAPLLKPRHNELILFEEEAVEEPAVYITDRHVLDRRTPVAP